MNASIFHHYTNGRYVGKFLVLGCKEFIGTVDIPVVFSNFTITLQMYMVNLWSLYRQMLYKIQTTAHKMKYTLFPVIFMVILRSCYCENPLKLWKMEYSLFL